MSTLFLYTGIRAKRHKLQGPGPLCLAARITAKTPRRHQSQCPSSATSRCPAVPPYFGHSLPYNIVSSFLLLMSARQPPLVPERPPCLVGDPSRAAQPFNAATGARPRDPHARPRLTTIPSYHTPRTVPRFRGGNGNVNCDQHDQFDPDSYTHVLRTGHLVDPACLQMAHITREAFDGGVQKVVLLITRSCRIFLALLAIGCFDSSLPCLVVCCVLCSVLQRVH